MPTVLVDAAIVLSRRALPDKYRQLNSSSCSHRYPFSLMISVFSSSPHLSLAIPTYASLSLGWSPTHQVPCVSFHDCVFDNLGRACAADVAISNAETPAKSTRVFIGYFGTRSYPVLRFVARYTRYGGPGYGYGPGPYPDAVIVNPVTGRWCRTESNGYQ
jgi:hypothetical protein